MPYAPIYLDNNATTPILPEVADAMRDAALRYGANPASQHEPGRQARRALEAARQRIGELLGARMSGVDADRVIFTSGGTEANNLALFGLLGHNTSTGDGIAGSMTARAGASPPPALLISAIEHPSISRPAAQLASAGRQIDLIAVDSRGVVRLDHAAELLDRGAALASVMLASNETGVLQPVGELARLGRTRGALVHTDAVQAVGKIAVEFRALDVDALSCTAHKFHGPLGIGALVLRHGVKIEPQLFGGFQQGASRPGTESVALAAGFAAALEAWQREAAARSDRMAALRDELERLVLETCAGARVIGGDVPRVPQTSNIAFVGLDRQQLAIALDLAGVAASTGSACASGSSEPSPALASMGLPAELINSSLRFSVGALTTTADVAAAARRISSVYRQLRRQ